MRKRGWHLRPTGFGHMKEMGVVTSYDHENTEVVG